MSEHKPFSKPSRFGNLPLFTLPPWEQWWGDDDDDKERNEWGYEVAPDPDYQVGDTVRLLVLSSPIDIDNATRRILPGVTGVVEEITTFDYSYKHPRMVARVRLPDGAVLHRPADFFDRVD